MSESSAPIRLPERFVIGELPALKRTVEGRRAEGSPVTFDGEAVRTVDSAALQFLLVCHATQEPSAGAPLLAEASEVIGRALVDIGAAELAPR